MQLRTVKGQEWNRVFLLVCAAGLFVDSRFFYALSVSDDSYYVIDLLHEAGISHCSTKLCDKYQFFATMTFLSWFISTT
ncbi:transmembrane protein, putative [Medicago truncatula]|uniref:Transmembrane protein, putative n=1 Tax=Medicago truncatula TaxID=3880 RepID=G7KG12_MEDTR|nr:transmembrane protein, putative [Medicago truncatula]